MSFHLVAAAPVIAPTPTNGTAAVQSNLGGTQPATAPSTPLPGNRPRSNRPTDTIYIPSRFPHSMDDLEACQYLDGVSEPFFSILARYYRSRRKVQREENERFDFIKTNHLALSSFKQILASGCLKAPNLNPKAAVEIIMDGHAEQLRTTDSNIETWIAERKQASELRAILNERIVGENARLVAANERREVAARIFEADGRGSWATARKEKWNAELARLREKYRKWEHGFSHWQRAYQMMLYEDDVFEDDIEFVMERQAGWGRWVGNWQIDSYFDEVEALSAEDTAAAQGMQSAEDTEAAQ